MASDAATSIGQPIRNLPSLTASKAWHPRRKQVHSVAAAAALGFLIGAAPIAASLRTGYGLHSRRCCRSSGEGFGVGEPTRHRMMACVSARIQFPITHFGAAMVQVRTLGRAAEICGREHGATPARWAAASRGEFGESAAGAAGPSHKTGEQFHDGARNCFSQA